MARGYWISSGKRKSSQFFFYGTNTLASSIRDKRQLHKAIIEIAPKSTAKGSASVAGFHTHILSDVPEDPDVSYVLARKPQQPEFIGATHKNLYEISVDGSIHERKM